MSSPLSGSSWRGTARSCIEPSGAPYPDEEGARDVAAEVLTRMRGTWPDPVDRFVQRTDGRPCRFETWLAVVVRNLAIDVHRSWHGRRMLPRAVARSAKWQQSLYRLVYWDTHSLSSAYETLVARGEFDGGYGELIEAANALHRSLPRPPAYPASRKPSRSTHPRRGRSTGAAHAGGAGASPEDLAADRAAGEALSALFESLDQDQRLLLRLYFLEGMRADALVSLIGASSRSEVYNRVHGLRIACDAVHASSIWTPMTSRAWWTRPGPRR